MKQNVNAYHLPWDEIYSIPPGFYPDEPLQEPEIFPFFTIVDNTSQYNSREYSILNSYMHHLLSSPSVLIANSNKVESIKGDFFQQAFFDGYREGEKYFNERYRDRFFSAFAGNALPIIAGSILSANYSCDPISDIEENAWSNFDTAYPLQASGRQLSDLGKYTALRGESLKLIKEYPDAFPPELRAKYQKRGAIGAQGGGIALRIGDDGFPIAEPNGGAANGDFITGKAAALFIPSGSEEEGKAIEYLRHHFIESKEKRLSQADFDTLIHLLKGDGKASYLGSAGIRLYGKIAEARRILYLYKKRFADGRGSQTDFCAFLISSIDKFSTETPDNLRKNLTRGFKKANPIDHLEIRESYKVPE